MEASTLISMSGAKSVLRMPNIYPDAVTGDRMRLIDPNSGQLEPITIVGHQSLFYN